MNAKANIKAAQIQTSGPFKFYGSGWVDKNQYLFSVTPGVDLADALDSASDLLSMCLDPIEQAGMGTPLVDNPAWLVHHALESAKAVIDSLKWAAQQQEGGEQ
ncbi:DUF3077 domain-containing protein [Pseudomonas sp. MT3]